MGYLLSFVVSATQEIPLLLSLTQDLIHHQKKAALDIIYRDMR
jgi:hypothetical protein